jgi:hypothetical protein
MSANEWKEWGECESLELRMLGICHKRSAEIGAAFLGILPESYYHQLSGFSSQIISQITTV